MTRPPGLPTVRFARAYWFPVPPAALWDLLGQFDSYPTWWAWLAQFEATPAGAGLVEGTELRGVVVPPLPGRLSLRVTLGRCLPPALIEATVDGDVRGAGTLEFTAEGEGTAVSAAWTLQLVKPPLRLATRLAHPIARWGHDQVVAMAVAGFRRNALPTATAAGPGAAAPGETAPAMPDG